MVYLYGYVYRTRPNVQPRRVLMCIAYVLLNQISAQRSWKIDGQYFTSDKDRGTFFPVSRSGTVLTRTPTATATASDSITTRPAAVQCPMRRASHRGKTFRCAQISFVKDVIIKRSNRTITIVSLWNSGNLTLLLHILFLNRQYS